MTRHHECPDCGSHGTERVHIEWYSDMIEETRICNECISQFLNSYNLFDQEVQEVPEP